MTDVYNSSPKILIAVPSHNEEESLPVFLKELEETGYSILVINDASTDRTEEVVRESSIRESSIRESSIRVLSLPINLGIGGGMQAAFKFARRYNYDIIVQMDGDGQHDPAMLPQVLAPLLEGRADCAINSRYLPHSPDTAYKTPFARRMGMHFSTFCLCCVTGLRIYDTTSGFRALNRKALSFFADHYPTDHPEAESLLLLHRAGMRIVEVPTRMRQRTSGQSLFTFFKAALYPLRMLLGFLTILSAKR